MSITRICRKLSTQFRWLNKLRLTPPPREEVILVTLKLFKSASCDEFCTRALCKHCTSIPLYCVIVKLQGSASGSEHSIGSCTSERSTKNTLLAGARKVRDDADVSIVTQATAKLDNTHLQMDESLFNPDSLWQRSTNRCDVTSLSRRVNVLTL